MNYTLRQLQVFHAIATHGSITKAARHLHLTQPAVSLQFKSFSEQFDFPLIEYQGKKLIITPLGKEVKIHAERILDQANELKLMNESLKEELTGTLLLSIVSTGKYVMPFLLAEFLEKHPSTDLIMDVTNKSTVVDHLLDNSTDFALVSVVPAKPDLNTLSLIDNELILVGNEIYAQRARKNLDECRFVLRETGSATRLAMEEFISNNKIKANRILELTSNEAVKQSVIAGLGVSLMPKIGIKRELEQGLIHVIDHPALPMTTQWNLVWRKNKKLSPVAAGYLAFLESKLSHFTSKFNR
jgi:DNA-binding transcriptional LysR family regulator